MSSRSRQPEGDVSRADEGKAAMNSRSPQPEQTIRGQSPDVTRALPDQAAREQALDAARSFIVQAPAGSGKTELLTLRYMKLLATCEQPEEVLAITFTKKAASEMRDRIIHSLNWCQKCIAGDAKPKNEIERLRLEVGQAVLAKEAELDWHLLDNPSRFRVQTIDSFCYYLAKQLPIPSQLGGSPQLEEDISPCFKAAIHNTLAYLETDAPIADDIETVLAHQDNDLARLEKLLVNLLRNRDQWSNHLFTMNDSGDSAEENLKATLGEWVSEALQTARDHLKPEEGLLVKLFNHAIGYLLQERKLALPDFTPLTELPGTEPEQLGLWIHMLSFLLTSNKVQPTWLSRADARHGFPAKTVGNAAFQKANANFKAQRLALTERLDKKPEILDALHYLRRLPTLEMDSQQLTFLGATVRLLQHLSAELHIAMQQMGVVDYTQISSSALLALGDEDNPTNIALALDHVIRHILVDEFQDTSYFQLRLLEKLTAGWERDDGRSLFLVGDPMQSCYGFRNANVGIYLGVWKNGLRTIPLDTLRLTTNFRSQANVVDWVNQVFGASFPAETDISRGAVPYSNADALQPAVDGQQVHTSIFRYVKGDKEDSALTTQAEARAVVDRVQTLYLDHPEDNIAILVRNRSHLTHIVQELRAAKLQWSATDIDRLNSLAVIDDLMAIARLVWNPGDRLGWIALLRAPWCGLGAADLDCLANHKFNELDIWSAVQQYESIADLSDRAKQVLPPFVQVMRYVLSMRGRSSLQHSVEACWNLLRGPQVCGNSLELESAQRFLELLGEQERAGGFSSVSAFEDAVNSAFVPSLVSDSSRLHLLTMHKAKGLEFDHVLLPSLNHRSRSNAKPLLQWHERLNRQGESRLFMAGPNPTGENDGPLYELLRHEQKLKDQLESTRLLYIAVTRAKKSAWLYGALGVNIDGEQSGPESNSLLAKIWEAVKGSIEICLPYSDGSVADAGNDPIDVRTPTPVRRLEPALALTSDEVELIEQQTGKLLENAEYKKPLAEPANQLASLRGTLIHRCLELYTLADDKGQFLQSLPDMQSHWRLQLRVLNLSADGLAEVVQSIETQVSATVTHPDLEWLFDNKLQDSRCELSLSRMSDRNHGSLDRRVVDRSFVDQDNVRWIIDYKSSTPPPGVSEEEFIEQQGEQYQAQLDDYGTMFQQLESRPIKKALLLTAIPRLVELPLTTE